MFLLTIKKLIRIFMHMSGLKRLREVRREVAAFLRGPEVMELRVGILGVVGINLAPEVHDGIMTGSSVVVAIDCASEQVRRLRRAKRAYYRWRVEHHELIESRVEAGIMRHDVLRRIFDSVTTLDTDEMAYRLTKHDIALWDYVDQLGRELCE